MSAQNIFTSWFAFARKEITLRTIFSKNLIYEFLFLLFVLCLGIGLFFTSISLVQPLTQYTSFLTQDVQPTLESGASLSVQQQSMLSSLEQDLYMTSGLLVIVIALALTLFASGYLLKFFKILNLSSLEKKSSSYLLSFLVTIGSLFLATVFIGVIWSLSLPLFLLILLSLLMIVLCKVITFVFVGHIFSSSKKNFSQKDVRKGIYFFILSMSVFLLSIILLFVLVLFVFTFIHPIVGFVFALFALFFWYVKKEILLRAITKKFFISTSKKNRG